MNIAVPSLTELLPKLAPTFGGRVVAPGDADYDEIRLVAMGNYDRRPGAIVRPRTAADVARAVVFARDNDLELAVRSGGHSGAGHSTTDGGIVIDLRDMNAIDIDEKAGTAWVETGATAGEVSKAVTAKGQVVGFGDSPAVGVGGITLGGGVGYFVRKLGLTIDFLLAAEVVTADGKVLEVDKDKHPDLFWAIRGGGGNFGVVTRVKFKLTPLPAFTGGMLIQPATAENIDAFVAASHDAPEELSTILSVMPAPPMPFLPTEWQGKPVMLSFVAYAGEGPAAEAALKPLRDVAKPLADFIKTGSFVAQMYPEEGPAYRPKVQLRTFIIEDKPRGIGAKIMGLIEKSDAMMRAIQLRVLGGAAARVPADETAYAHRKAHMMGVAVNMYGDDAEIPKRKAWAEEALATLAGKDAAAYVNFLGDEGRARAAYPGKTWDRLREIKAKYDPQNLFRLNQNVPPAA